MLKLLIVDDERLDREGLKNQVDWQSLGISCVDTAKSGFDAMETINREKPDILVTDVKMPGMSGLELAQKASAAVPWIKIIFVSGFDDFEFVKNALLVKAYEYILKPVDSDELAMAARHAVNERLKEKKEEEEEKKLLNVVKEGRPLLRQKFLLDIIYGVVDLETLWQQISLLDAKILNGRYCVMICEVDDYDIIIDEGGDSRLAAVKSVLAEAAAGSVNDSLSIETVEPDVSRLVLIFSFLTPMNNDMIKEKVYGTAEELIDIAESKCGLSLSVGIGNPVDGISDIHRSYNESCSALSGKMYAGKGSVLFYYPKTNIKEKSIDIQSVGNRMMMGLTSQDRNNVLHNIDYLFDSLESDGIYNKKYIQNICINITSRIGITLMDMNESIGAVFGENSILWDKLMKYETILDIRQWLKNIFKAVFDYLEEKDAKKNKKIINEIIKYIEHNFNKDITLKDLASEFYYSPNYLGSLFKNEMKQGFSDYLAAFRMKKAAEFLKKTNVKTYEVAGLVGYRNVSSFINQFKSAFNLTPKEYRERN